MLTKLRELVATKVQSCPWASKQTHSTLIKLTLEEADEVAEAISKEDTDNLVDELGDLLFHVLMHSQLAENKGDFTIDLVISNAEEKLKRRNPHIFEPTPEKISDEKLEEERQRIKSQEKCDHPRKHRNMITCHTSPEYFCGLCGKDL